MRVVFFIFFEAVREILLEIKCLKNTLKMSKFHNSAKWHTSAKLFRQPVCAPDVSSGGRG